jgi:hypothetical protein
MDKQRFKSLLQSPPASLHVSAGAWRNRVRQQGASAPITIQKQGSFAVGGTILGDPDTQSLHCDHGYVDYQIPVNPRRINLVMWHSAAARRSESLGRRRRLPEHLPAPRLPGLIWDGHADRPPTGAARRTYDPPAGIRQLRRVAVRHEAPNWFEGIQFPTKDPEAWNQASRARYLEFDTVENAQLQSDAAAKLMTGLVQASRSPIPPAACAPS